jgi:ABC-2 type transport system permease protein
MLRNELGMMFRRRRLQALLLVLGLVPVAIMLAVRYGGGPDGGDGPAFLNQVTRNGVFATLAALTVTLPVFLPMAVAVVAGDTLSGEANLGTLRYLLIRPIGRVRLLATKAAATAVFCLAATTVVAVCGLIAGVTLFPIGRVTTLSGTTISLGSGMVRISAAALVIGLSLMGLAAIGIFISTLTDVPVGAMAATLGVYILVGVLDNLPQVSGIHPWLFTHDWLSYADLLRGDIAWSGITRNLLRQLGYIVVFGSAAWARFTTKDVLA